MHSYFSFFFFLVLSGAPLFGQQKNWYWGTLNCALSPKDSSFLRLVEDKMRREALDKNSLMVFTGVRGGDGYRVRMTKAEMLQSFNDTTIQRSKFASAAELASLWNSSADTCLIISFQHMLRSGLKGGFLSCNGHVPLRYYRTFLEEWQMYQLRELMINSWTNTIGATRKGDTLFRVVRFHNDSNVYLAQASWNHLGWTLKSAMLGGAIRGYTDASFARPMNMQQIENALVQWDSIHYLEDPYNPGTFILAPIKIEQTETGVVVYERWVRDDTIPATMVAWSPAPYMHYHRELIAYGVQYTSGAVIWHKPSEVSKSISPYFNWIPYEESFRAERYETMHIELGP